MRASRAIRTVAILMVAGGLLTACGGDPEPSASPSPSTSETPTPTPSPEPEPITAPLTGIEVDAEIQLPAILAKIDDHPDARPQFGLETTDIVYEELVEGGLTRYVAVWHSNVPQQIGPVRSIRPMDPGIAGPFGGMMAFSGGQPHFVAAMQAVSTSTSVIHGGGTYDAYYSRGGPHAAPHNVILQAAQLQADNAQIAPPQPQFAYADDEASPTSQAAGGPASQLSLAFSQSQSRQWGCDASSGRWARGQQGVADLDASGNQLSAANVVVLRVQVIPNGDIPQTMLEGYYGDGFVASGCSWVPVTWSKPDIATPIQILDASGQPVVLTPGNTWVELVPNEGSATVS
ncbi:DUF3048 domain-containing protein [Agrococcus jejuensis]|uniref:DUF3048 domain-containing protein n=1 Tax=Agrococcus jejuensis TaxID=399736 RepID=UPI0011A4D206|nr:DUF3048 domain-containing protein [Agrococcus jejuensis]